MLPSFTDSTTLLWATGTSASCTSHQTELSARPTAARTPMNFPGANTSLSTGWESFSADGDAERFHDDGHGNALLVSIEAPQSPPRIEPAEVSSLRWSAELRDVTGHSLGSLIKEYSSRESPELTILRLALAGVMDPRSYARLDELRQIVHNRSILAESEMDGVISLMRNSWPR